MVLSSRESKLKSSVLSQGASCKPVPKSRDGQPVTCSECSSDQRKLSRHSSPPHSINKRSRESIRQEDKTKCFKLDRNFDRWINLEMSTSGPTISKWVRWWKGERFTVSLLGSEQSAPIRMAFMSGRRLTANKIQFLDFVMSG